MSVGKRNRHFPTISTHILLYINSSIKANKNASLLPLFSVKIVKLKDFFRVWKVLDYSIFSKTPFFRLHRRTKILPKTKRPVRLRKTTIPRRLLRTPLSPCLGIFSPRPKGKANPPRPPPRGRVRMSTNRQKTPKRIIPSSH